MTQHVCVTMLGPKRTRYPATDQAHGAPMGRYDISPATGCSQGLVSKSDDHNSGTASTNIEEIGRSLSETAILV